MGRIVGSIGAGSFGGLKKVSLFTVFAIAVMGFCWAVPAHAADKLVVKGTDGTTNVFTVGDTGDVQMSGGFFWDNVNKRLGVGTTNPQSSLQVSDSAASTARGLITSQHSDDGNSAQIAAQKSRGTEGAPAAVINGDFIGSLNAQAYDGSAYQAPAFLGFQVDGNVTAGSVPTAFVVRTGASLSNRAERLNISSSGNVKVDSLAGSGNAYVCVNASGTIYRSSTACN